MLCYETYALYELRGECSVAWKYTGSQVPACFIFAMVGCDSIEMFWYDELKSFKYVHIIYMTDIDLFFCFWGLALVVLNLEYPFKLFQYQSILVFHSNTYQILPQKNVYIYIYILLQIQIPSGKQYDTRHLKSWRISSKSQNTNIMHFFKTNKVHMAIPGALTLLVRCHAVKSLQLIWNYGTSIVVNSIDIRQRHIPCSGRLNNYFVHHKSVY